MMQRVRVFLSGRSAMVVILPKCPIAVSSRFLTPGIAWNTSAPFQNPTAVLLERSHAAKNSLVHEMGEAPLHSLFDLGASDVDQLSNVIEDRPGKVSGLFNVRVDARVHGIHENVPSADVRGGCRINRLPSGVAMQENPRAEVIGADENPFATLTLMLR
jgi:hypothetical protein